MEYGYGASMNVLNKNYSVDKHGVVTKGVAYTSYSTGATTELLAGVGVDKKSADYTVILDTANTAKTITVADDAKIFYVDADGEITESSYKGIVKDEDDAVYAVVDEYMVEYLVIVEDGGVETITYDVGASDDVKFCKTNSSDADDWKAELTGLVPGTTVFVKTMPIRTLLSPPLSL